MGKSGIIVNVCTGVVALITALVFKGKAKEAEKSLRDALAQIEEQSKQLKELGTMDKKLESGNKSPGGLRAKLCEFEALLDEVTGKINERAFDEKGEQQCWTYYEMSRLLGESWSSVETEQNDGTILDNRIKELQSCENCLKGIVCRDGSKEEPVDGGLKIDCGKAEELKNNLINARNNLFRACIEGYEDGRREDSRLRHVVIGLSEYARGIREKGGVKVEDSSSSDVNELQEKINSLLEWLFDNADKASCYVRERRSSEEVEFCKLVDELLKEWIF